MKHKYTHPKLNGKSLGSKQKALVEAWSEKSAKAITKAKKGSR